MRGWRKAREFTATGHSGLTFLHFMAATHDPLLASFDVTMANIPYATGYSPLRWQTGTDVMIPKSTASLRVNKLWTILLLDPEFNQNNEILGRSLISQAEQFSQMHRSGAVQSSGVRNVSPVLSARTRLSRAMTG